MIALVELGAIAGAFFIAAAAPGPATVAVMAISMRDGRQRGMIFGLGLSIGLAFWGFIAATGLGAVLQASSYALTILKLFGGAYLLWLAFCSARSAAKTKPVNSEVKSDKSDFIRGLVLNLSNPKAVFAWMAVLALGIGDGPDTSHLFIATGICIILGFVIYTVYAFVFSTTRAMGFYQRSRRWVEATVAGLFTLAGLGLIRSALVRQ